MQYFSRYEAGCALRQGPGVGSARRLRHEPARRLPARVGLRASSARQDHARPAPLRAFCWLLLAGGRDGVDGQPGESLRGVVGVDASSWTDPLHQLGRGVRPPDRAEGHADARRARRDRSRHRQGPRDPLARPAGAGTRRADRTGQPHQADPLWIGVRSDATAPRRVGTVARPGLARARGAAVRLPDGGRVLGGRLEPVRSVDR
jgi:hypothetical protein